MTRANDEAAVAERVVSRGTSTAEVALRDERRAKTRYDINLTVTLFGEHNFYVGLSENLSEGGIFVRTQQVLARRKLAWREAARRFHGVLRRQAVPRIAEASEGGLAGPARAARARTNRRLGADSIQFVIPARLYEGRSFPDNQ